MMNFINLSILYVAFAIIGALRLLSEEWLAIHHGASTPCPHLPPDEIFGKYLCFGCQHYV